MGRPCLGKFSAGFDFCEDCPDEARCCFKVIEDRCKEIGICTLCHSLTVFKNRSYCDRGIFNLSETESEKDNHHYLLINEFVSFCLEFDMSETVFEDVDEAKVERFLKKMFGPDMKKS